MSKETGIISKEPSEDTTDSSIIKGYTAYGINQRLKVQVEKPTSEMRQKFKSRDYYKLPSNNKGVALIINIIQFRKYELKTGETVDPQEPILNRNGAQLDTMYMQNLWKGLGYKIFPEGDSDLVREVWCKKDVQKIIQDFREYCNKYRTNSIAIFVGSHGQHGKIICSDAPSRKVVWCEEKGNYQFDYAREMIGVCEDIIFPFYHCKEKGCPGLKGKPKMFFINACQVFSRTELDAVLEPPVSDLMVITAQAPGYDAWRNTGWGSWFTHCLTYVFMKFAKEKSVQEMVRLVGNMMKNLDENAARQVFEDGTEMGLLYGQIPEVRDIGMQELFLM